MRRTIFEIPAISVPMAWACRALLWIMGWRFEGEVPGVPKCIVVVAPHTSNWDFPIGLLFAFALGLRASFFGKDSIFRWPILGRLFYRMGGIPVERSRAHNRVEFAVRVFAERDCLMLGITPEGTRKKVEFWKSGFYRIALDAHVPIALAFLDFGRKVGGFGPLLYPTGATETDMKPIQEFYGNVTARHPELAGPVVIRPREK